ncbi:MAG TPA: Asp23/Gls24 family envelope stress response protein [Ktedonobacteraceae bacterium]
MDDRTCHTYRIIVGAHPYGRQDRLILFYLLINSTFDILLQDNSYRSWHAQARYASITENSHFGKREDTMRMPKAAAIQPQHGSRPLGKIEVLPNAVHSTAVQAAYECYGVLGIASPRLHNGQAVLLPLEQSNQGVRVSVIDKQLVIEIYVVLEYGLRISEIAHNIMSSVKFSLEKMLGMPVAQVNVNVQGLLHGPTQQTKKD